jgi:UDP-N-acetylglucosamine 4,6-dehydratase/5-epimerase
MLNELLQNVKELINNKIIFITGGTGTFGHEITKIILEKYEPKKLIIFSRDEFKQYNMKQIFPEKKYKNIRYFIGDVRDYDRLLTATKDVDVLFHAAAMKQVDTVEYNPFEAIKTNIYGTENVIKASIANKIKKVIGVSTDKCVSPTNLYGATKLCLEKLIIHGNIMAGEQDTIFSVLRYGNVINSRGSVVPLFLKQKENNLFTITDPKMTRFTLTINQAINFVLNSASVMIGGEIFIPKLPSYDILQLTRVINPESEVKVIGIRPGEKIHESMFSVNDSHNIIEKEDYFVLTSDINFNKDYANYYGEKMKKQYDYNSGDNTKISDEELKKLIFIDEK